MFRSILFNFLKLFNSLVYYCYTDNEHIQWKICNCNRPHLSSRNFFEFVTCSGNNYPSNLEKVDNDSSYYKALIYNCFFIDDRIFTTHVPTHLIISPLFSFPLPYAFNICIRKTKYLSMFYFQSNIK